MYLVFKLYNVNYESQRQNKHPLKIPLPLGEHLNVSYAI